eukprot:gnl/Spiro4/265_TR164_c0_g1_i2.p1 gnl/Spiro4/265_TR164_c0_g1~~gnl/Spiro4/265_TR164_c0_g1_i2.p1  ORF type:complete len:264 (+),score=71.22 gnl/Spiro4/265_TR164_c0_g1_i2:89-880(+)
MVEAMRKQLDALMGTNRDGGTEKTSKHFTDADVCKHYLAGLCPHDLFTNTKMDMGDCDKLHSAPCKQQYDEQKHRGRDYGYERDLMEYLGSLVRECDVKISRAQKRLEEDGDADMTVGVGGETPELRSITLEIQELQGKAEELGEQGNVSESMAALERADALKKRKTALIAQVAATASMPPPSDGMPTRQKLRVCDVCGARLSMSDSDRRLADHFGGKMHMGYLQMRQRLSQLREEAKIGFGRSHADRDSEREASRDSKRPLI